MEGVAKRGSRLRDWRVTSALGGGGYGSGFIGFRAEGLSLESSVLFVKPGSLRDPGHRLPKDRGGTSNFGEVDSQPPGLSVSYLPEENFAAP